jgi:hypothetical protein
MRTYVRKSELSANPLSGAPEKVRAEPLTGVLA